MALPPWARGKSIWTVCHYTDSRTSSEKEMKCRGLANSHIFSLSPMRLQA